MKYAETALLLAVRDRLIDAAGYSDKSCAVEYDEQLPAIAGDLYVAVMPGGWTPGPRHRTSGGVNDLLYSVDVSVLIRIRAVPRDRRRDVFAMNLDALNERIDEIWPLIDFDYTTINAASTMITERNESEEGFCEPLQFSSVDRRPRLVAGDVYAADSSQAHVALARSINFNGARRITTK